jgi:Domain of unknown function (DUF5666)
MMINMTNTNWMFLLSKWLISSLLIAGIGGGCGGGLPGTGGTGVTAFAPVYSVGNVSGFGSVIVNGVRFDDQAASIKLDGIAQPASQVRLGMVAQVTGAIQSGNSQLGRADKIEIWAIALGSVNPVSSTSFSVAGMNISTNAATVFEGLTGTSSLRAGDTAKVWGFATNATYSAWRATRVQAMTASTQLMTSGLLGTGTTPSLNGYSLSGALPTVGSPTVVTLLGYATGKNLNIGSSHVFSEVGAGVLVEREGVITTAPAASQFKLGITTVDIGTATVLPSGTALALGQQIEVEGTWDGTVIKASKIIVKSEMDQQEVEIDAVIEQFVSVSDFTVRGQRCDASGLTVVNGGKLSDLRAGIRVHLHGLKSGDKVRVTELEIVH